jgi:hypothetical protein
MHTLPSTRPHTWREKSRSFMHGVIAGRPASEPTPESGPALSSSLPSSLTEPEQASNPHATRPTPTVRNDTARNHATRATRASVSECSNFDPRSRPPPAPRALKLRAQRGVGQCRT